MFGLVPNTLPSSWNLFAVPCSGIKLYQVWKSLIDRLALLLRDTESERAVKMNISLKTSGEIAMEKSTGG